MYDFKQDIHLGNYGELTFLEIFPDKNLYKVDFTYEYDFLDSHLKRTFELKTEFNKDKLFRRQGIWKPTVFIEKFSSLKSKNPYTGTYGGVYRAFKDEVDFYIYFYIEYGCYFIFKTEELYQFMMENESKYEDKIKIIPNKGYETMGYAIPIKDILINIKSYDYYKGHPSILENKKKCKEFIQGHVFTE